MYLKEAKIQTFRGITDMSIEFKPGINLLIGDNGYGKTSIIEALAIGLNGLLERLPKIVKAGFQRKDFQQQLLQIAGASNSISYISPYVHLELDDNGTVHNVSRTKRSLVKDKTATTGSAPKYLANLANDSDSQLPLLLYLGVSRVFSGLKPDKAGNKRSFPKSIQERRNGYHGCLVGEPSKVSIMEWIQRMTYESFFQNKDFCEMRLFNDIVARLMQSMNDMPERPAIRYSSSFDDIVYVGDKEELPVSFMSAGYQSLLWITMEIAFRLAQLNPLMKDSTEATGIVLIDEIDMHLHPKWQQKILVVLEELFPKVQFIATTHAPLVISSARNVNLISIEDNQTVKYQSSAFAFTANEVLESRLGAHYTDPNLLMMKTEFDKAFNKGDIAKAKAIYEQMVEKYTAENVIVSKAYVDLMLEMD